MLLPWLHVGVSRTSWPFHLHVDWDAVLSISSNVVARTRQHSFIVCLVICLFRRIESTARAGIVTSVKCMFRHVADLAVSGRLYSIAVCDTATQPRHTTISTILRHSYTIELGMLRSALAMGKYDYSTIFQTE